MFKFENVAIVCQLLILCYVLVDVLTSYTKSHDLCIFMLVMHTDVCFIPITVLIYLLFVIRRTMR